MTIDDFEWVEQGFDCYNLTHKRLDMPIATIRNFSGWTVNVWGSGKREAPLVENGLDLDAAKMAAIIYATQNMERYDAFIQKHRPAYRKRTSEYRPEAVPRLRVD